MMTLLDTHMLVFCNVIFWLTSVERAFSAEKDNRVLLNWVGGRWVW